MDADKFERLAGTKDVSSNLKSKSIVGAIASGAGGLADFVLRLGSTMVLARLLLPEDFGLLAMAAAVSRIADRFSTLGLSTATVQVSSLTHRQCSNLFWVNVGAGLLFAGALVLSAPSIAAFFGDVRLEAVTSALSVNFVCTGLQVQHDALLRRQMKLSQIAASRVAATVLSTGIGVGLALSGFGYWALVWKEIAQGFFICVGSWVLCPWIPAPPSRTGGMRGLLSVGRNMTVTQLLFAASTQLDTLLIGRISGAAPLGLYRQAYNLMMLPIDRLNAPIQSVSQPGLSVLQTEPGRYKRYYERILFIVSLLTVPLGVFTIIYAYEIVIVFLGERWQGAAPLLQLFGIVASIEPALATSGIVLITCGKTGRLLLVNAVSSSVLAVLVFVGAQWGAVGVAGARVATLALTLLWGPYYSFSGTPVSARDFARTASRPVVAGLVMGGGLLLLRTYSTLSPHLLSLLVGAVVAGTLYVGALIALPGGRERLVSFLSEVVSALRRRPNRDAGT